MKARKFGTIDEIKTASLEDSKDIAKSAYQEYFKHWTKTLAPEYYI